MAILRLVFTLAGCEFGLGQAKIQHISDLVCLKNYAGWISALATFFVLEREVLKAVSFAIERGSHSVLLTYFMILREALGQTQLSEFDIREVFVARGSLT